MARFLRTTPLYRLRLRWQQLTGWRRRAATLAGAAALAALLGSAAFALLVALEPLPAALGERAPPVSLRVFDRDGHLLDEVRAGGVRRGALSADELPDHVVHALLAAEDKRFFEHPGIDPLAIARAVGQAASAGHWVSGASTLTQQLARTLVPRPRTLRGKLHEAIVAVRIERSLDKPAVLAAYLNHVQFAPALVGLEAASQHLFDKPARSLDLAEAALLAGLPRGPTLYDPQRAPTRALARRAIVLRRMQRAGWATEREVERALATPLHVRGPLESSQAPHLVSALARGKWLSQAQAPQDGALRDITTTLDTPLQAKVSALVKRAGERLRAHDGLAAAALVVDNATREVIAYVGSPDFWSREALGQNDGVTARRQPGSTLKPFIYAAAMQHRAYTAATLLPDVELHLASAQGTYSPQNYDGQFRGPVLVRQALAASLNVPAVYAAREVGPDAVLAVLHAVGFTSLTRSAAHYGAALALGDGEVTLAELANAYVTLARGGRYAPLRFVHEVRDAGGALQVTARPAEAQALPAGHVALLVDILSDANARSSAFGRSSPLEFAFPVAAKTGTSKGYRDNWTVGFSERFTVAVWVGNFDGHPLRDSSGVTGAGPLFHEILVAAERQAGGPPLELSAGARGAAGRHLHSETICPLSGQRPGPSCPHPVQELFANGTAPHQLCELHTRVQVALDSGLAASDACPAREWVNVERYPATLAAWAQRAGRPQAPGPDPRCPPAQPTDTLAPRVRYPRSGSEFTLDPHLPLSKQRIPLRAIAPAGDVWFELDGERLGPVPAPHELSWQLRPGSHRLRVLSAGRWSPEVRFLVRGLK